MSNLPLIVLAMIFVVQVIQLWFVLTILKEARAYRDCDDAVKSIAAQASQENDNYLSKRLEENNKKRKKRRKVQ